MPELGVNSMPERRVAQFVMKISKYCNLRCTYCYEYRELGNKERMSLNTISQIFEHIIAYAEANRYESVSFVWDEREPFLIPLDYYDAIGQLQRDIFADKVTTWNVVQTNLTVLTDRHIEFLKSQKFFSGIGISFDVHGNQRVDSHGRLKTEIVLKNLQKMIDHQIGFGAISVLARNTLPHVRQIYRFYDQLGIESRFLPFYLNAFDEQITEHGLTYDELVAALKSIFDEWMTSERATPVDPIDEYIGYAIAYIAGRRDNHYYKELDEYVFLVDLDGGVYGQGEAYAGEYKYGDLVHEGFGTILTSQSRRRAIEHTQHRQMEYCKKCPYFGACPGFFVGDASPQQQRLLAECGCPVKAIIGHIVTTLEENNLSDLVLTHAARRQHKNTALPMSL